jgi:RHS repeat-associated protein
MNVIYGQRKDPAASTSLGSEEEVSSGSEEGITYSYLYDGDGNMIAETIGLTTTVYIGTIYEKKDQGGVITQKKYFYAGSLRVAVSTKEGAGSWEVNFLLSDHLGSTSITTADSGDMVSEMRYSPWGSLRFSDGVSPTDYQYNGHLSKVDYFGLIYFQARWFDPYLKRWTQPDSIIPNVGNPIDWDHYAYVWVCSITNP